MSKSLLIVESPTKVKTLKGFLGPDFIIKGSQGHVRDLPKSGLAVDIENDFEPRYELLEDRKRIIDELKKAAKEVDVVYLASDPDREGEAIAWHIREALKLKKAHRIEFNEITKTAVQRALSTPREIDMDRVNAQQARRVLDRIIGYKISPLLARKIQKGLSAGRVQSVALRLICEREREIQAFKTEEYWSITALLSPQAPPFQFPAKLISKNGEKLNIGNEEEATALVDALRQRDYVVSKVTRREKRRNPLAPFITSTLQQDASRQHGFSAKRTMMTAQQLYEGIVLGGSAPVGLITYMRTDSTAIAKEAQEAARGLISNRYGQEFVPDSPPVYKNRKSAQEAHEAIRPADVTCIPENIEQYLTPDQFKLYRLIWRRFVASQMKPAILDTTTVDIAAGEFGLRASGSIVKFAGFLVVYEEAKDEDKSDEIEPDDENAERKLPPLEEKQNLDLKDILPRQHFTQPPPRYTEATLVKTLEENGIGRPSTYAQILSTIQDRNYAALDQKRFVPSDLGFTVNDKLVQHFPREVDVQFTAGMEEKLDAVEEGKQNWVQLLRDFWGPFEADLKKATDEMEKLGPVETDFDCPTCGKKMLLRRGRFGQFFSCSDAECKTTMNLGAEGEPVAKAEKVAVEVPGIETGSTRECEKCGKDMVVRASRRGPFWGCTGFPKCRNTIAIEVPQSEAPEGENGDVLAGDPDAVPNGTAGAAPRYKAEPIITEHLCPNCGEPLAMRSGRFGPFLGCTGYPKCKTIIKVNKDGSPRWPEPGESAPAKSATKTATKTAAKKAAPRKKKAA
jgi:DNA topoisomerase-1